MDLVLGVGTNPMTSYVAFTRVGKAEDMLIYRPFDVDTFGRGDMQGPQLLLAVLRGEEREWEELQERYPPTMLCSHCSALQYKHDFAVTQWARDDGVRYRRRCVTLLSRSGTRRECMGACRQWMEACRFSTEQWRLRTHRCCLSCVERRRCSGPCGTPKPSQSFTARQWTKASTASGGVCIERMRRDQPQKGAAVRVASFCRRTVSRDASGLDAMASANALNVL